MAFQNAMNFNFDNFEIKWHLDVASMINHKKNYKGENNGFFQASCDEFCESIYARDSFIHQKCSDYTLINLLFDLCMFVRIIDSLVIHYNPHPRITTHPSSPKCYELKNVFTFLPLFSSSNSHLNFMKSLGCIKKSFMKTPPIKTWQTFYA